MKKFAACSATGPWYYQWVRPRPKRPPAAPYRLLNTISIGGVGGWDYLSVDPAGERLYVSHGTQVEVVDLKTRKVIGTISDTPGVHGIESGARSRARLHHLRPQQHLRGVRFEKP